MNWLRKCEVGDMTGDLKVASYTYASNWDFLELIHEPMGLWYTQLCDMIAEPMY